MSVDTSVRPQDDFFGYVNNNWLKNNPIPATETSWGTFYVLRDKSWKAVDDIVKELPSLQPRSISHNQKLLRDFFNAALQYEQHADQHFITLNALLNKVKKLKTPSDIARCIGSLHRLDIGVFWTLYVGQDDKDSSNQVLRFYQSGLSLPNRDYYLDESANMKKIRSAYTVYYRDIRKLLPDETMLGCRRKTRALEQQLAEASWTDVELRDVQKNYTRYTLNLLKSRFTPFDWDAYFEGLGWEPSDNIVIDQDSFVAACVELIEQSSLEAIRAYLQWHIVNSFASWTTKETAERSFAFYGTVISGQKEMKPLWKRAVLLADRLVIGEALGKEYALRHFPESSKKAVQMLVEDIRTAYRNRIQQLTWMSSETKKRAQAKLSNIKVFIGYPSVWKDLSKLEFTPDDVVANILFAREFSTDIELRKIGKKPDDEDWEMNAHTVNAYNHPNRLEIVFPAAILQPPFYDPNASRAANLGGIGAVIGHEFTHGFDDQGCQFDEQGNTHPWQTKKERAAFDRLANSIVKQANAFETVPGTFLQGKLILGEAIADIGGLTLAVEALEDKTKLEELFTNFAACECGHTTTERAVELAKIDPHPPSKFRVNNVVNHVDDFYTVYNVTETDKLYLPLTSRANIW